MNQDQNGFALTLNLKTKEFGLEIKQISAGAFTIKVKKCIC
jgi:hypothetical protein